MRAISTAVSLVTHVGVIVAAVWTTTQAHPSPSHVTTIFPLPPAPNGPAHGSAVGALPVPTIDGRVDVSQLALPKVDGGDAAVPRFVIGAAPGSGPLLAGLPGSDGGPVDFSLVDDVPVILAGPVPAYPDLLRQAGVQGRVVLEAVIDTLGHVEAGSIVVVERTHPEFVAPAQHSLLASLFRPARVRGVAVRVRVRIPIDFVLRDGRLWAR